jgi:acyl-[acyl-carrier-protein]-phospholipid O-acyltransferase / long-chain-fatty-acid--[acyl-carrier-protein] ligase
MHQAHTPSNDGTTSESDAHSLQHDSLRATTFIGLLLTQFLGATNDNILRWLVIGLAKSYVEPIYVSTVLAVGSICLVLPYVLLAAPAGYLADRFSKRDVIINCKVAEIVIMAMAIATILFENMYLMFGVVALIGCQAALFGPAKLGSIPEMLRPNKISSANGLIGLTTVVATVVGTGVGSWLVVATGERGLERWWLSAFVLVGVAVAGWIASLFIMPLKPANPLRVFPWDMPQQTVRDLTSLGHDRALLRVALGIMFFWTLAMLAQLNIDQFVQEGAANFKQTQSFPLLAALIVGVGLGSVLAGVWSGGKVELGILPLGAGGLVIFSFLLYTVQGVLVDPAGAYTLHYFAACVFLLFLGLSAGLFDVPLAAFMQDRSPPEHRGALLAASNFLTFGGMLLASIGYWVLRLPVRGEPLFSPQGIFFLCGLATVPVFVYIIFLIPQASIKFLAWLATHSVYKIRVHQRENIPEQGGAILVPNHISWLDGLLLFATSSRQIRMLIDSDIINTWRAHGFAKMMGAIPIKPSPKSTRRAIEEAREALKAGELVCIFPEGGISRSGQLQRFKPGVLEIQRDTGAPIIPVYLDELWGSIFSFRGGKFFWKWPSMHPRRISIWFGKPIPEPCDIHKVRQAVQDLGADAVAGRKQRTSALPRAMIRNCRKALFRSKLSDSTGVEVTGGKLLAGTLVMRRLLLRHVLGPEDKYVGILLPPSVGSVITNAALSMDGRVTANLNYTATPDVLNSCLSRASIRKILTSRKAMANPVFEKFKDTLQAEFVYLEDLRDKALRGDKLYGFFHAFLVPSFILDRVLHLHRISGDDVATVVFTSGSTGMPKGVMLTHHNIATNVEAIEQVVHPRPSDSILGIVPFFHSLGFTVTLWGPLLLDIRAAYHVGHPTDTRIVAKLARMRSASILLATPTFLRMYLRRCDPEELSSLEVVVAGAEKMPISLCDAFEKKFGIRPVEGYGTTELSPLVSVNVPPSRSKSATPDMKEGSVGRPVPSVSAKAVDPETYEDLPLDTPGMLLVKGPNVMKGYLGQPEETAKVMHDGWYVTGDIAMIDSDGFIHITGRLSRFSKIGGEMVPHIRIEEAIQKILGLDEGQLSVVVTSVPDERKGERLVVVHTPLSMTPQEICERLGKIGVPNLWIPGSDSFLEVEAIPVLGSGKTDLKAISDLAKSHFHGG